jgi:hypothetical protein
VEEPSAWADSVGPVRTIGVQERRARLARRHHLLRAATRPEEAAAAVVGLHSSDPVSVYVSAWARVKGFRVQDLEDALYERRSLVRMLGMRRTMFVVPVDLASAMDEACAKRLAATERRRLLGWLDAQGVGTVGATGRWLDGVVRRTYAALERRGEATARQLSVDVPELTEKLSFGEGKRWGGTMGMSTRVLFLLATEGRIVRGKPLGTWVSAQYRWSTTERWLGAPLEPIDHDAACAELLRRYLRAFGPATIADVRWWTGWTAKLATATLETIDAVAAPLEDGGTGFVLPDDVRRQPAAGRWVRLLPGLDPTVMGWKERDWYLGEHGPQLFDRSGNAGPTVWADGRVVGGWTQTRDGGIAVELLERVDAPTRRAIDAERERLRAWLGDVRFTTRFRSPIEAQLSGS